MWPARVRSSVLLAIPLVAFSGATAWAQETEGSEEVVVTAMKRSQSISKVAASISALDEAALEERGISNLNDIQQQTPAVSFGVALGTAQVSVRGVGLTIATGAGEPGVAVHLDGVYEARPALSNLAQFDLKRVEVLRGPQGTLYGRNATGGAVNFISNTPTDEFEARIKLGYAEYNEAHAEAVVSGPLGDGVRGRLGVTYTNRGDGFLENIAPGQGDVDKIENFGARGKLSFDLSEAATLDLQLTYVKQSGSNIYLTPTIALDPNVVAFNPVLQGALFSTSPDQTAMDTPTMERTAYSPVATLAWDFDDVTFKSISAYSYIDSSAVTDADGTSARMGSLPNAYTSKQFTQEFNLSGSTDSLDWIVGAFYLNEKYNAFQDVIYPSGFTAAFPIPGVGIIPIPIFAPGNRTYQHWSERRQSFAGFADGTYHLTDDLSVFAGIRYSVDEFRLTQSVGTLPNPLSCTDLTNEEHFYSLTPRAGLQYAVSEDTSVYASVSRGYKAGGLNFGTCGDPFGPEKLTAYEVGYKGRLPDAGFQFSVSAFYYDYEDLQVYQLKPISEGGGSFIDNAPKATIKGIEADLAWSPDDHFQINVGAAFIDAQYDEYSNTDSSILGSGPVDLSGYRIPKSPKFTGNIGIQYSTDVFKDVGRFIVRAEAYHSSKQFYTEFNKPQDAQDAYTTYNAFVTWENENSDYSVRLYARNLSDERYFNFVTATPLSGTTLVTYAPPRQIGIEISADF